MNQQLMILKKLTTSRRFFAIAFAATRVGNTIAAFAILSFELWACWAVCKVVGAATVKSLWLSFLSYFLVSQSDSCLFQTG